MASMAAVRAALAAQIAANVTGLRATGLMTGQVSPPMAVVLPARGTFLSYEETFEPGVADYPLEVVLLVSYADERAAQGQLDGYLSATGASSVPAAILKDPTLGGTVDYCVPESAADYGLLDWAGVSYLSARIVVTAGTH
jgi:hypothetical protein